MGRRKKKTEQESAPLLGGEETETQTAEPTEAEKLAEQEVAELPPPSVEEPKVRAKVGKKTGKAKSPTRYDKLGGK